MAYLFPWSFLVILKFETDLIIHNKTRYQDFCLLVFAFVSLDKQSTSLTIVLKQGGENFDFAVNILRGEISFELTRDGFRFINGTFRAWVRNEIFKKARLESVGNNIEKYQVKSGRSILFKFNNPFD